MAVLTRNRLRVASREGAVATEMAVLAPVIAILLFGVLEWGSAFWMRHHMIQATREGARVLALAGTTQEQAIQRTTAYLEEHYPGMVEGEVFRIATSDADASQEVWVEVRISYREAAILGGLVMPQGSDMVTRLVMRKE